MASATMVIGVRGEKAKDEVKVEGFQADTKTRFGRPLWFRGKVNIPGAIDNACWATPHLLADIAKDAGTTEKMVLRHFDHHRDQLGVEEAGGWYRVTK